MKLLLIPLLGFLIIAGCSNGVGLSGPSKIPSIPMTTKTGESTPINSPTNSLITIYTGLRRADGYPAIGSSIYTIVDPDCTINQLYQMNVNAAVPRTDSSVLIYIDHTDPYASYDIYYAGLEKLILYFDNRWERASVIIIQSNDPDIALAQQDIVEDYSDLSLFLRGKPIILPATNN